MSSKARKYKPSTIRRLDTLSGNECSNPDCSNKLIAKDKDTIISKICHIKAASPKGPRYDQNMDDEERRSYDNLLLLCDECHSIIDNLNNVDNYPVELLEMWKKTHENNNLLKNSKKNNFLITAINAISNLKIENEEQNNSTINNFKICDKIAYNSIKRNKSLIDEYKIFNFQINSLYMELENQGSFKKENLLRNIRNIYIKIKGRYVLNSNNPIDEIRKNSDNIIEDIENELYNLIEDENKQNYSFEISLILVDAFLRCKILEKPIK